MISRLKEYFLKLKIKYNKLGSTRFVFIFAQISAS